MKVEILLGLKHIFNSHVNYTRVNKKSQVLHFKFAKGCNKTASELCLDFRYIEVNARTLSELELLTWQAVCVGDSALVTQCMLVFTQTICSTILCCCCCLLAMSCLKDAAPKGRAGKPTAPTDNHPPRTESPYCIRCMGL